MICTFKWTDRNGTYNELSVGSLDDNTTTFETLRNRAIGLGYPGHSGGWWNWFVDDGHAFLNRLKSAYKRMLP